MIKSIAPIQSRRASQFPLPLLLVFILSLGWGLLPRTEAQEKSPDSNKVTETQIHAALEKAGDNRAQIQKALDEAPSDQQKGIRFLIAYMPEHDLQSLSAAYLLENTALAYQARQSLPWGALVPEDIFLNDVLPYASINERRDNWRKDFMDRFLPLVEKAATPGEAGQILNRDIYKILNVQYHANKRPKPDQSPYESMEASYASCTGLSILLIDACRAVGVPARFAGTPRWATKRGNHSWVEIWDAGQWNFTGACEYNASGLNKTWFQNDAAKAIKDDPRRAIYASSWKNTGTTFPLIWDRDVDYVAAYNVTDSYTGQNKTPPLSSDQTQVAIQVWTRKGGARVAREIVIIENKKPVARGTTKGADDDSNNWLEIQLQKNTSYMVQVKLDQGMLDQPFETDERNRQTCRIYLETNSSQAAPAGPEASASALGSLAAYLEKPDLERPDLARQPFASTALTRADAQQAARLLWQDQASRIRKTRQQEMTDKTLTLDDLTMKFDYSIHGEKPEHGRSLYISMHGGGGAPTRVNDRQWENQKKLYQPGEGVYVAPRAPTDTWNLWHQAHIDKFFDRLIQNMVVFEEVDPNRVYIVGYSAGGDGVFQLAPRMADRWAAAAMMAGHPNETSPLGLRNIGFILQMGGEDAAYKRNQVARDWKKQLTELREQDPDGYPHQVIIYEGLGHWMQKKDAVALPWMAKFIRNPVPDKIVWKQDDVTHSRFYWIALPAEQVTQRTLITATRQGQEVSVESTDLKQAVVLLNDDLINLDQPVTIKLNDKTCFEGIPVRTIVSIDESLQERLDFKSVFPARITVSL